MPVCCPATIPNPEKKRLPLTYDTPSPLRFRLTFPQAPASDPNPAQGESIILGPLKSLVNRQEGAGDRKKTAFLGLEGVRGRGCLGGMPARSETGLHPGRARVHNGEVPGNIQRDPGSDCASHWNSQKAP